MTQSTTFTCDGCGATKETGTRALPKGWRTATADFKGSPGPNQITIKIANWEADLCPKCVKRLANTTPRMALNLEAKP